MLWDKFREIFLAILHSLYLKKQLVFSSSCQHPCNSYEWQEFRDSLYSKDWCLHIKENFNGLSNALEYLGRYTHKIAISNNRVLSVAYKKTTFSAKVEKPGNLKRISFRGISDFGGSILVCPWRNLLLG